MEKLEKSICVGIDLGTSRSSISSSNGERHVVDSYVGWPVDMVARKVIKKKVLIGGEALENRSMLDLRRPLEQGVIKEGSVKDDEAVRELLRHLFSLVGLDGKSNNGVKLRAVVGVPAEAMQASRQRIRTAMNKLVRRHKDGVIGLVIPEPLASLVRRHFKNDGLGDLWKALSGHGCWEVLDLEPAQVPILS